MEHREIKAFICRSVKAKAPVCNHAELERILDRMITAEMQSFWSGFTSDRCISATHAVDHWKTREQSRLFEAAGMSYAFYPKVKDENGKYVIVREDLKAHMVAHLIRHIDEERRLAEAFRASPLFDRLHVWIGLAIFVLGFYGIFLLVLLSIVNALIPGKWLSSIATPAAYLFVVLLCLYFTMPFVRMLLQKCHLWPKHQNHQ